MYYQCIIEPKGGHILEHDQWKEDALLDIHENSGVSYNSTRKDTKADEIEEVYNDLLEIAKTGKVDNPYRYFGLRKEAK